MESTEEWTSIPSPTKDDQLIKSGGFKLCNLKEEMINVATKVFVLMLLFFRYQNQWQNRLKISQLDSRCLTKGTL